MAKKIEFEPKESTSDEITKKISDCEEELFNLRYRVATAHLENPKRIWAVKKLIARCKTELRARELAGKA